VVVAAVLESAAMAGRSGQPGRGRAGAGCVGRRAAAQRLSRLHGSTRRPVGGPACSLWVRLSVRRGRDGGVRTCASE